MSADDINVICQRLTALETKMDMIIAWQEKAPCASHERFVDRAKFMLGGLAVVGGGLVTLGWKLAEKWLGGKS